MMRLAHGFSIADLYRQESLERLDGIFLQRLALNDGALHGRLLTARSAPDDISKRDESALILAVAPVLEAFLIKFFGIAGAADALAGRHAELAPIYEVKRQFVQRQAAKLIPPEQASQSDGPALLHSLKGRMGGEFDELAFAKKIIEWQSDRANHSEILETARQYAAWAVHSPEGQRMHRKGVLFKMPSRTDPLNLVPSALKAEIQGQMSFSIAPEHARRRDGFSLTDTGTDLCGALDQSNYCILCHTQQKDSCSIGLREKGAADTLGPIKFKKSPFDVPLNGCPLEEKISEFHTLNNLGYAIGALAVIVVDNPMACRDRSPHLQRLHEIMYLSEDRARQHPTGRDADAEGRAGVAWGRRDLQSADAMEPAQHPPANAAPSDRATCARGGHGPCRIYARPLPHERRARRGRHRWAEDRAALGGPMRCLR